MPVHPGDVLIGDNDGVIALPPDRLLAILEEAEAILREEAAIFEQIDRGLTYQRDPRRRSAPARRSRGGDDRS